MKKDKNFIRQFEIPFSGLKLGIHEFDFEVGDRFFEYYELQGFTDVAVEVTVSLEKKSNMKIFSFTHQGKVVTECSRCGDEMEVEFESYEPNNIYVKFGLVHADDGDESVTLEESAHSFNVSDLIYQFISLTLPMYASHESEDLCNPTTIGLLNQDKEYENENSEIDPRWAALKKLK